MLLDRAVHRTFSRFALVVPAFVLADALGGLLQFVSLRVPAGGMVLMLAGMVLENRARVIVIASSRAAPRESTAWVAALRHPAALAYAVVGMVEVLVPYLAFAAVGTALAFAQMSALAAAAGFPVLAYAAAIVVLLAIVLLLLGVALLVALAGAVATVDTVIEQTPPHRALLWWLRQTFRMRSPGQTLAAAAVFIVLVAGVPEVLGMLIPWGPPALRSVLFAIPEGIADAVALYFVWCWRDAILEGRHGHDIQALLDGAVQPSLTESPSASSPGVTTSQ